MNFVYKKIKHNLLKQTLLNKYFWIIKLTTDQTDFPEFSRKVFLSQVGDHFSTEYKPTKKYGHKYDQIRT